MREPCFIGFGMEEREKGTSALFQTVRFYLTRVSDSGYCVPCVSVCTKDVSFISFPSASTRRLLTHKDVSKEKENGKKIRPVFLRHVGLTAIATPADIERSDPTFFFLCGPLTFFLAARGAPVRTSSGFRSATGSRRTEIPARSNRRPRDRRP